ncbi:MAG: FUSC family protein [Acetobacteraceae bacterium]|nr:FUSC family protein [Acetobacteraceae bacterium]
MPPLSGTLRPGLPLLLYGVRLWAAVCIALFVAFRLELENPYWAGTTAAIVCQPAVGASLRKGWFRLLGTVTGAVAVVALTACFPQSRAGFLLTLALWGAACALIASLLRNFASYAAALAGYTTAIVAGDELGAVGGANGEAFNLAVTRASEICLGIVCAGVVLASTDMGGARRRLATLLAALSAETAGGLLGAFRVPAAVQAESRWQRRELMRRVSELNVVMDQAAGEISSLPFRPRALQAAVDGLFQALSAWRIVARHLEGASEADTAAVLGCLEALRAVPGHGDPAAWEADPLRFHDAAILAVRRLVALPTTSPSLRLLADRAAEGLLGISRALTGLALLGHPRRGIAIRSRTARLRVPDALPALINAVRAFLTIGAAALIWIASAWPSGATVLIFASVTIILFAPREEAAFGMARNFMLGTGTTAIFAAVIGFAVLPRTPTFAGFCAATGLVLVPAGALSGQAWRQPMFIAMAANFIPLLGPANPMTYDPGQFYNTAAALLAGVGLSALAMRLIPPLPPELRARRLLTLTLRDLRRLATGPLPASAAGWESRVYGRLSAMPDQADPLQRARLTAALSVGAEIIRLRRIARRFRLGASLEAAMRAIGSGDSADAVANLERFDRALAAVPPDAPGHRLRLRARGTAGAITEALAQHASYFDAEMAA